MGSATSNSDRYYDVVANVGTFILNRPISDAFNAAYQLQNCSTNANTSKRRYER